MSSKTIVKAHQTCYACPSQWDAWTDRGEWLYLRFRHGHGSVTHYPDGTSNQNGIHVADFEHGGPMDGLIDLEEFCRLAGLTLALTTPETSVYQ